MTLPSWRRADAHFPLAAVVQLWPPKVLSWAQEVGHRPRNRRDRGVPRVDGRIRSGEVGGYKNWLPTDRPDDSQIVR